MASVVSPAPVAPPWRRRLRVAILAAAMALGGAPSTRAQDTNAPPPAPPIGEPSPLGPPTLAPAAPPAATPPAATPPAATPPIVRDPDSTRLELSALWGANSGPARSGLHWRVFQERAEADGTHKLVAESTLAAPVLELPKGGYIVHVAFGLAGAVKRVTVADAPIRERLVLNAGALRIGGLLGDAQIQPNRLSISVYVPDGANPEGKLVARNVKAGETIRLPEGNYHLVSTYLEAPTPATTDGDDASRATNSVVAADVRVQAGKLTDATVKHRAALLTLKLVSAPGAGALANTSFTILTPGGDVLREVIGAFPSVVLAEGEYVAIARHEGRTFQSTFQVLSGRDRDVEILAREPDSGAKTP